MKSEFYIHWPKSKQALSKKIYYPDIDGPISKEIRMNHAHVAIKINEKGVWKVNVKAISFEVTGCITIPFSGYIFDGINKLLENDIDSQIR